MQRKQNRHAPPAEAGHGVHGRERQGHGQAERVESFAAIRAKQELAVFLSQRVFAHLAIMPVRAALVLATAVATIDAVVVE